MYLKVRISNNFKHKKNLLILQLFHLLFIDGSDQGYEIKLASAAEFLMSLTNFIEQQFKGRISVTSSIFLYEQVQDKQSLATAIWKKSLQKQDLNIFYLLLVIIDWTSVERTIRCYLVSFNPT